ncbi:oxygen-independent coproporphyrinogen III oxidase [Chlamydia sp.]|uniref:oxygen-independent coproporphyrinogen III oxidase n=1 Tax=Chlamydia sp. TaxID=35827 RepID=UPI0025C71FD9|nr:oxygen-independent coproporphyrinogen III oxidase [Chlamydia sp.]MBQ8499014.1 oxygen-independent coproporphyrinogen III oxidase [Chlamydia sp.]
MFNVNFNFLKGLHQPAPRYTSYPTIVDWEPSSDHGYTALKKLENEQSPLSLYFHIPFCQSMCLYCGCAVVLNRKIEVVDLYIETLIQEMQLAFSLLKERKTVSRIHFGGGTPSRLSRAQFQHLFTHIHKFFDLSHLEELAIEFDPRSLREDADKPLFLHDLGFNRVSLGIQDTQWEVQEAVRRRQPYEESLLAYEKFRELKFTGINIDLIYGLPKQTPSSFQKTIQDILDMRPDRLALFSFAHVPWVKPHQKALQAKELPSIEEKFTIYSQSRHTLIHEGYHAIGLDHFSLPDDPLTLALKNKTLIRNFQGYSLPPEEDLLGFGMSATSFLRGIYLQNSKDLREYSSIIHSGKLATVKGKILSQDDKIRKWVIHTLMCSFSLSKLEFEQLFHERFDLYFADSYDRLCGMESAGLIRQDSSSLQVTPLGELFVRVIATAFDHYFLKNVAGKPLFSKSI